MHTPSTGPPTRCSALVRDIPVLHTLHLPAIAHEINEALRVLDQQGHPLTLSAVSRSCAHSYASFYTPIDYVVYNGLDVRAHSVSGGGARQCSTALRGKNCA